MTRLDNPQPPTAADYGDSYFASLYGSVAGQTPVDVARDGLIVRLVERYVPFGRLVDVGCGYGYLLGRFGAHWELYGSDISAHASAVARRRLERATVAAADVQRGITFRGPFDVVLAVNVIEHLPDPLSAVQGIAAALRPGGIFVAHLPTISSALGRWIYAHSYESDPTHVYRPSGDELNRLVEAAGFRTLHALYCPFWPAWLWRALKPHPAYLGVYRRAT